MRTRFSRRLASLALIAALAFVSARVARGARKPFSPDAPGFRRRGPAAAKVLIVEFSDFQCPACRVAEKPLADILALYDGKVRFVFKHYPLRMHAWAVPGAVAAECAGRQGKFWEYHDMLYANQDEWTNEKADGFLAGYAKKTGLDAAAWNACRQDPAAAAAVKADQKDGDDAWVGATPTLFINGRRFVGARQLTDLGIHHIDKELAR